MKAEKKKRLHERIRIGVASCLLGNQVRYNAGDKYDELVVETLGRYFEWVPVCPEFEMGLGVPREPMHLAKVEGEIRLVTLKTDKDLTESALRFARKRVTQLKAMALRGYVLKKNSPSCGMERVKVYGKNGVPFPSGRGVFADILLSYCPSLPVEEEGRLRNPALRENWVSRVFAYHDLRNLFDSSWKLNDLVAFHTRYKLVLLSHSEPKYRELGRLVARAKELPRSDLARTYEEKFMATLTHLATKKSHTNVMQHIVGHLKDHLDAKAKQSLLSAIDDYRLGLFPLSVPLALLAHFVRYFEISYLQGQAYFEPHPKELALRNHV